MEALIKCRICHKERDVKDFDFDKNVCVWCVHKEPWSYYERERRKSNKQRDAMIKSHRLEDCFYIVERWFPALPQIKKKYYEFRDINRVWRDNQLVYPRILCKRLDKAYREHSFCNELKKAKIDEVWWKKCWNLYLRNVAKNEVQWRTDDVLPEDLLSF